ncbi:MAG: nucleoside recognition domain-containing protein [Chloroflexota bacterium]
MSDLRSRVKGGLTAGVKKGLSSFIWMCKIVIPLSFLVAVLQWTGWLSKIDFLLNPLMNLLNLPAQAGLPILTGMLVNLYAVIAIITVLPFSPEQMLLIAIFSMIAHNLIPEGVVQHKSGFHFIKSVVFRIVVATITVLIVSQFLGDTSRSIALPADIAVQISFWGALKSWALNILSLLIKIFVIIMVIMIVLDILKSSGWINYILKASRPLARILGLPPKTVMMWVVATLFGLLYGGAVVAEEAKKGELTKEDLERLHIFVGIHHAAVEDPSLFAVLGLNAFWLWVPRFVMAVIAVQTYRLITSFKHKQTVSASG